MKRTTQLILPILLIFTTVLCSESAAQTVEIGGRSVPLSFTNAPVESFDTNRVAQELTAFFRIADTPETLFRFEMAPPGESKPLRPACPRVPPMSVANDIRYVPPPNERVVVGPIALGTLLESIEQSAPYSNTWAQADALLAGLSSGAITNDATQLRQAFVLSGGQLIDTAEWDTNLVRSVSVGWTSRHFYPISVLDWEMNRWDENGPLFPVFRLKFDSPQFPATGITHDLFVFQNGRWRAVLW